MISNYKKINKHRIISRSLIKEHISYNQTLHQNSVFPSINTHIFIGFSCFILSFSFKDIKFSKKRALPFFIAIELLVGRKCVVRQSKLDNQQWKRRKGILVGCKTTLRGHTLFTVIDRFSTVFPRIEKFKPTENFIFRFYKENLINCNTFVNKGISPNYKINLGELILIYPIEFGLGMHIDVKQLTLSFNFKSFSIEERFFFIRYVKLPLFA